MKASPELREKMWELCYDLLPEEERSALIDRIKSDPHAARLYAEVRLQADLVGYASAVEDSSLNLSVNAEKLKTADLAPAAGRRKEAAQPAAGAATKTGDRSLWAANALAMAAGLALMLLLGVGFFRPLDMNRQTAQLFVTEVEVPGQLIPGVTTKVDIRTASPQKLPLGVPVDVKVVDAGGNVLHHELLTTSADGRVTSELPGTAVLPGTRLWIEARSDGLDRQEDLAEHEIAQQYGHAPPSNPNLVEAALPVSQPKWLAYFVTDKPAAAAGEEVQVAGVALDSIRLVPQSPPRGEVEVTAGDTTRRIQPAWIDIPGNVAQGTISLPDNSLRAKEGLQRFHDLAEQSKPNETRALLRIESVKEEARSAADRENTQLGMRGGEGFAEQGRYRYGANRASDGAAPASPQAPLARGAAAGALAGDESRPSLENPTADKAGAGKAGTDKREIDKSAIAGRDSAQSATEKKDAAKLDALESATQAVKFAKEQRQFIEAGKPVEVELAAEQANKQLEAKLTVRGQEVIRQNVEPRVERQLKADQDFEQRVMVAIDVPPEVNGNFNVKLFDAQDHTLVLDQNLYRAPARGLRFEPLNLKDRYDPGETVQLRLKVVNEQGAPAAAIPAVVRVWNEDYVADERSQIVMLEDAVLKQDSAVESSEAGGMLAGFGRPGTAAEGTVALGGSVPEAIAPRGPRSGDASHPPKDQLAQSNLRQSVADLKKAEELAGAVPAPPAPVPLAPLPPAPLPPAPATAATTPPKPAAVPLPVAPLHAAAAPAAVPPAAVPPEAAGGPQIARSDDRSADAFEAPALAMSDSLGATSSASTYAMAPRSDFTDDLPAFTASNELAIGRQLELLKTEDEQATNAWRAMFGRVLIAGGLVALAVLGLLFVMQQEVRWSSGTLALVASAASLVIGAAWITGGRQETMIAMAPGNSAPSTSTAVDAPLPKAASPSRLSGALAENVPERPLPMAVDVESVPPPLESASTFAAPAPSPAPAQQPAAKGKSSEGTPESLAPAKPVPPKPAPAEPAPPTDPDAKNEPPLAEKTGADAKQSGGKLPVPERGGAASTAGSGAGGFGGGQSRRAQGQAGLAGLPGGVPKAVSGLDREGELDKLKADAPAAAPSALYFNPQLATAADGTVTIEFQLPKVASEYRVLLDAYGNGRVGSSADLRIICKEAAK